MIRKLLSCIGVLLVVAGCATDGQPEAAPPDLPQQTLLASSMRKEPVPGWTYTVADLDLPAGTVVRPVGNIGDRGIFLGITREGWSLLGLDVNSGERIFGPTRLGPAGDATDFDCFVNRPPKVLCVRQPRDLATPSSAWVVDADSGEVTYDGPTDVRVGLAEGQPQLEQIGDHVVAEVVGKGIYGVGERGELTWFVPGDGMLSAQVASSQSDTTRSSLAVQGSQGVADVVFSAVDGSVVKPALPEGVQLEHAVAYPDGFGYEYTAADSQKRVAFFDESGKLLSETAKEGALETRSIDVPTVVMSPNDRVMTLDGRTLVELPPSVPTVEARLIGDRLFVANDADHTVWRQFDVRTGKAGRTCEGESLGAYYIGSDGEVAVALGDETPARGVDLASCEVLWSIAGSQPGEAKEVWKVGTALVQRTDDKIFSLIASH